MLVSTPPPCRRSMAADPKHFPPRLMLVLSERWWPHVVREGFNTAAYFLNVSAFAGIIPNLLRFAVDKGWRFSEGLRDQVTAPLLWPLLRGPLLLGDISAVSLCAWIVPLTLCLPSLERTLSHSAPRPGLVQRLLPRILELAGPAQARARGLNYAPTGDAPVRQRQTPQAQRKGERRASMHSHPSSVVVVFDVARLRGSGMAAGGCVRLLLLLLLLFFGGG